MIDQLKPLLGKLCAFSKERMGFSRPPRLFLKSDRDNSQKALGKTAFYDPGKESITIFIDGRHPKDILRSFAHELVHHTQNLKGDLAPEKMTATGDNYAQECPHMRKMEKEAYLQGNMCFRDWEDTIDDKDIYIIKLAESKFLKENKTMTTKITKEFLKEKIIEILNEQDYVRTAAAPENFRDIMNQKVSGWSQGQAMAAKKKASGASNRDRIIQRKRASQEKLAAKGKFEVSDIQSALVKGGYFDNTAQGRKLAQEFGSNWKKQPEAMMAIADGKYGGSTMDAIIAMQKDLKLEIFPGNNRPDGVIGGTTLAALKAAAAMPERFSKNPRRLKALAIGADLDNSFENAVVNVPESALPAKLRTQKKVSADKPDMSGDVKFVKKEEQELEEIGCNKPKAGKRSEKELEENEELEEAGQSPEEFAKNRPPYNKATAADRAGPDGKAPKKESKIQTPEQENTLYENRFTPRNNRLFEKLVKQWTK